MFIKQNRFSVDLGETKIIWHMDTPIIVPSNFTDKQEEYIIASLATLHLGNTSVDNILNRHFTKYSENKKKKFNKSNGHLVQKFDKFINQTLIFQKKHFEIIDKKLSVFNFTNDSEIVSFCGIIFKRLKSSFKAVRTLVNQGFYFETYSILRQMVEQIAFAYDIHHKNEYKEFISPTKCITSLKTFYPSTGNFYGILSSKTHIDKTQIKEYYVVNEKNNNGSIILQSIEFSVATALDFLVVLDIYCCVFELIFNEKLLSKEYLTNNLTPKKTRISRKYYLQTFKKYEKLMLEKDTNANGK